MSLTVPAPQLIDGSFAAFLFDMDGTLIDSIAASERIWAEWALKHGVDVESFLPTTHGVRDIDTITRLGLPGVNPEVEARAIALSDLNAVEGIDAIAGAAAFLESLPADRWGS